MYMRSKLRDKKTIPFTSTWIILKVKEIFAVVK